MNMMNVMAAAIALAGPLPKFGFQGSGLLRPGAGPLTDAEIKASADHDRACRRGQRAKLRARRAK